MRVALLGISDYLKRAREGAEEKARYLATLVDAGADATGELLGGVVTAQGAAITGSLADMLGMVLGTTYQYTPTDEGLAALGELLDMDLDNENRSSNNVLSNLDTLSGFFLWASEADVNLEEMSDALYEVSDGAYEYSEEKFRTLALVNEIAQMEAGIHPKGYGPDSAELEFAELLLDQSWVTADQKASDLLESSVDSANWANDLWLSAGPTRGIPIGELNTDEIDLWEDSGMLYHNGVLYGDPLDVDVSVLGISGDARDFWTTVYRANGIVGAAKAAKDAPGGVSAKAKSAVTSNAARAFWLASVVDWLDLTDAMASAALLESVEPMGIPSVIDSQPDAEEETPPLGEPTISPDWDFGITAKSISDSGVDLGLSGLSFDIKPGPWPIYQPGVDDDSWPWEDFTPPVVTPPDPPDIPPIGLDLEKLYRELAIAFGVGAAVGLFASMGLALPDNHLEINLELESSGTDDEEDESGDASDDDAGAEEAEKPPLPTYSFEGTDLEIGTDASDSQDSEGSVPT